METTLEDMMRNAYLDVNKTVVAVPFEPNEKGIRYAVYEIESGSAFVSLDARPDEFLAQYPVRLTSDLAHLIPVKTPLFTRLIERHVFYVEPRPEELTGQD